MILEWHGDEVIRKFLEGKGVHEEKTANDIASKAKSEAPVDSGRLRNSIDVVESKYENGGFSVTLGDSDTPYASYVELGTPHTATSGKEQRNSGFFRRAMLSNWKNFKKDLEGALNNI